jgi:ABC-type multidrug transport system ATPase subunit
LNLQINPGEIVGIIGHNGAGKSTTLKMIAGLVEPTSGHIQVMGHDMQRESIKVKGRIGYLPEESSLYEAMTARQYLFFFLGTLPDAAAQSPAANRPASRFARSRG